MLLELAIGDAYGAGFEYANTYLIQQFNDLSHYVHHPRHKAIRPGMYTDDTQMSIAVAEAIISGERWTPLMLADKFVECFKRDQRTGYASGFYGFLLDVQDGTDFLERIRPNSDKSGAAMRAGPVGIYPTPEEVIKRCQIQAATTHNTPDGINAACAAALMTHYFFYRHGPKAELADFIHRYVPGDWLMPWEGKVKSKGWMSVQAAITAVMRNDSMSTLLQDCIAFTGDVDTVATIALAAASGSDEVEQDLPQHLIDMLENGPYGRDYLISLDRKLLQTVR